VADPLRPGHEIKYHPGETNLRMADVVVINKVDTADAENIHVVRTHIQQVNHEAIVIEAASPIYVEEPDQVRGKRVLVVEDGPTITHGEMAYGAGLVAARRFGAEEIVNPRPHARGSLLNTYDKFAHIGAVLPAMGYGPEQVKELEETINATPCDLVLIATPIDLRRVMRINHPAQRVRYELQEIGRPNLEDVLARLPEAGTAATARG
jgi:predicted GTPase